jgi:hypothetical protein
MNVRPLAAPGSVGAGEAGRDGLWRCSDRVPIGREEFGLSYVRTRKACRRRFLAPLPKVPAPGEYGGRVTFWLALLAWLARRGLQARNAIRGGACR